MQFASRGSRIGFKFDPGAISPWGGAEGGGSTREAARGSGRGSALAINLRSAGGAPGGAPVVNDWPRAGQKLVLVDAVISPQDFVGFPKKLPKRAPKTVANQVLELGVSLQRCLGQE